MRRQGASIYLNVGSFVRRRVQQREVEKIRRRSPEPINKNVSELPKHSTGFLHHHPPARNSVALFQQMQKQLQDSLTDGEPSDADAEQGQQLVEVKVMGNQDKSAQGNADVDDNVDGDAQFDVQGDDGECIPDTTMKDQRRLPPLDKPRPVVSRGRIFGYHSNPSR